MQFYRGLTFQEIFNRTDNWISEGSGWVTESTGGKCVNVFIYSPLLGSSYIELPDRLRNSKKSSDQYQNKDNKCWHIRHLNPLKIQPKRITKADRRLISSLDYYDIKFPVSKKDYGRIKKKNSICINVFF